MDPITIALLQFAGTMASAAAAYFIKGMKTEITGLRDDLKEERDARGSLESELAAHIAVCNERHKGD